MTDESPREGRPLESLRREVEAPRTAAGMWLPLMALASATMLTIVSGVAVMARPAHRAPSAPVTDAPPKDRPSFTAVEQQELERALLDLQRARAEAAEWSRDHLDEVHVPCNAAVYHGDLDGRAQPFEECIVLRRR